MSECDCDRRYAEGLSLVAARKELVAQAGKQPKPARAFAAAMQQIAVRLCQVSSMLGICFMMSSICNKTYLGCTDGMLVMMHLKNAIENVSRACLSLLQVVVVVACILLCTGNRAQQQVFFDVSMSFVLCKAVS